MRFVNHQRHRPNKPSAPLADRATSTRCSPTHRVEKVAARPRKRVDVGLDGDDFVQIGLDHRRVAIELGFRSAQLMRAFRRSWLPGLRVRMMPNPGLLPLAIVNATVVAHVKRCRVPARLPARAPLDPRELRNRRAPRTWHRARRAGELSRGRRGNTASALPATRSTDSPSAASCEQRLRRSSAGALTSLTCAITPINRAIRFVHASVDRGQQQIAARAGANASAASARRLPTATTGLRLP